MTRQKLVLLALSVVVGAVLASAFLMRSTGTEFGSGVRGGSDGEVLHEIDPVELVQVGHATPPARTTDAQSERAVPRLLRRSEPRTIQSMSVLTFRETVDVGQYLDPDYHYPDASPGPVSDVGEFRDPDDDVPPPLPPGGVSDVGGYVSPDEAL